MFIIWRKLSSNKTTQKEFPILNPFSKQSRCSAKTDMFERNYHNNTPRKINIDPENDGLEDDFPFLGVYSQVPC